MITIYLINPLREKSFRFVENLVKSVAYTAGLVTAEGIQTYIVDRIEYIGIDQRVILFEISEKQLYLFSFADIFKIFRFFGKSACAL